MTGTPGAMGGPHLHPYGRPRLVPAAGSGESCGSVHGGGTSSFTLTPRPAAAKSARDLIAVTLADWRLSDLTPDVSLVASELVANALLHGAPPAPADWAIGLRLVNRRETLLCAVTDASPRPPVARTPEPVSAGGRGLRLVAGFSDRWGWDPCSCGRGKTVWARFVHLA